MKKQLNIFRKYYPVKTICMHGSPLSKYDNKLLWKYYNYKVYDIIGEPYFDVNFFTIFYLTDTGRRWDGDSVSIRDKVTQNEKLIISNFKFKSTTDIIQSSEQGDLPVQIMFTFHP